MIHSWEDSPSIPLTFGFATLLARSRIYALAYTKPSYPQKL
jgi:hypothetical protein